MRVSGIQAYNQYNVQKNKAQVQNNKNVSFGLMSADAKKKMIEIGETDLQSIDYLEKTPLFQIDYDEESDYFYPKMSDTCAKSEKRPFVEHMLLDERIMGYYKFDMYMRWANLKPLADLARRIDEAGPATPIKEIYQDYYADKDKPEVHEEAPRSNHERKTTALEEEKERTW